MIRSVVLAPTVLKSLKKLPKHIVVKLQAWVDDVEENGLEEIRKRPGYHDEPLRGQRSGQRSVRLSRAYRAIYVVRKNEIEFVLVEEVTKHEY